MMSLKNKHNVFITGSSRGIGLAIAKQLQKTFNVYINGRSEKILSELTQKYGFSGFVCADLTKYNFIDEVKKQLPVSIDILINNAGVYYYNPIEKMSDEEIETSIKLNTLAPFKLIKHFIPHMKEQKWGKIINIGSISGVMGEAFASAYSMTKSSLIGMTKALALELAQDNITVNIINPGWVDTELIDNDNLKQEFSKEEIIETIPQKRFVTPRQIASTCEFLISENAETITGQSINICAGLSLGC